MLDEANANKSVLHLRCRESMNLNNIMYITPHKEPGYIIPEMMNELITEAPCRPLSSPCGGFQVSFFPFQSHVRINQRKGEIKLINSSIPMQLPVRGCLQETRDPGNRSTALLHCDRQQRLHHCAMPSKAKTRIPALDPDNCWEKFVKIVDPITLTQEKPFFHTFNLFENTLCALAKNDHSKLASPPTALRFYIGGVAGTTGEPSRVGWDAQVDHMGISLRPSSAPPCCHGRSHLSSSLLCNIHQAEGGSHSFTFLALFVAKTRSGAKVVDSYSAGTPQGLICCIDIYWNAIYMSSWTGVLTWKYALYTRAFRFPHMHQPYCLLYTSFSHSSLPPASPCVPLTNGARQLVFLH